MFVVIIIFFVPYTASGFAACGKLFGTIFNADYFTAMVISAAVIVIYTTLGGFLAASTSDFIQSVIMTIALVIVLSYGVMQRTFRDFLICSIHITEQPSRIISVL